MINTLKRALLCIAVIYLIFIAGCMPPATVIDPVSPVKVEGQNTKTVVISKIVVDSSLNDKDIGRGYNTIGIPSLWHYKGKEAYSALGTIEKMIESELKATGYPVLHSEQKDGSIVNNDFQIGGIISDVKYDYYLTVLLEHAEASVTVQWQLLDQHTNLVVYDSEKTGKAKGPAGYTNITITEAAKGSLLQVLADEKFVCLFKKE